MVRRALVAVLVIAILAVGGYLIDRSRAEQESKLSGFFESQPTIASSRIGGRVVEILVKEGDLVKKGQPLVRMEDASYEANVQAQRKAAEQAGQQYNEMVNGPRPEDIAHQEGVVKEAEASLQKLINGPLPEEIRASTAKYVQAKAQYRKMVAGSRPEEIASARAAANVALEKLRQTVRGLTVEEKAQLRARLDSAVAEEALDKKNLDRSQFLFDNDAISRQQLDASRAAYQESQGRRKDAEEALRHAELGPPPEELGQAQEAYRQAQAQYELVRNGNRKEDVESARQDMIAADQNLALLLRGSRREDVAAAKARLDQATASLEELKKGNRKEEIAKSKAALQQAQLQAESQAANLIERTVYSESDAIVDRVLISKGDLLADGAPVIQLSDPADIWLRVYLPEESLPLVVVGDTADLAIDGITGPIQGKVESIATTGEFTPANLQSPEERAKQVFAIRIRLAMPDPRVKAGMYATVRKVGRWPK